LRPWPVYYYWPTTVVFTIVKIGFLASDKNALDLSSAAQSAVAAAAADDGGNSDRTRVRCIFVAFWKTAYCARVIGRLCGCNRYLLLTSFVRFLRFLPRRRRYAVFVLLFYLPGTRFIGRPPCNTAHRQR